MNRQKLVKQPKIRLIKLLSELAAVAAVARLKYK